MSELAQSASEANHAAASPNHAAAPAEQPASPTDQPSDGPGDLRRRWPASVVPLVVLIGTAVAVNLWWIDTYRRGLPFDIDEAGYLQRALTDASFLTTGGLGGFLGHLHNPDPYAPLLPAFAAVVHWMTGVGPIGLIATQQFFYVVLLVATWCIARRLGGRMQALAATAVVAAVPGIFEASRTFEFALVAGSMLTAALATQLWAGRFDRLWPVMAWGVVLGLAALSRTMILGLLPGLLVALGVRLWSVGLNRRRVGNALLGLGVALVVAWGWYSAYHPQATTRATPRPRSALPTRRRFRPTDHRRTPRATSRPGRRPRIIVRDSAANPSTTPHAITGHRRSNRPAHSCVARAAVNIEAATKANSNVRDASKMPGTAATTAVAASACIRPPSRRAMHQVATSSTT